ncbi:MAG: TlpA family protein disulfide reductase [Bacteroidales bacterium]|nr:TlpA family protein disulfide reductase [Candidatus Cacconaster merdequi]
MRRLLLFFSAALLLAGCSGRQVTVYGDITGYDGRRVTVSMKDNHSIDTVSVDADGRYSIKVPLDAPRMGYMTVEGFPSRHILFIPGQKYEFDIDLTSDPVAWEYEGRNADALDCASMIKERFAIGSIPPAGTFKEFAGLWESRLEEGKEKVAGIGNKAAREFLLEKMVSGMNQAKLSYAWHLQNTEGGIASDTDYMEFFNSLDLNEESAELFLPLKLRVKVALNRLDTTLSDIDCYLGAINDIAPTQHLKDSLTLKFAEDRISSGEIHSEDEGNIFMDIVSRYVTDENERAAYRNKVESILSLREGSTAPDFELIDRKGNSVSLSSFAGKIVYVDFWATWCMPGCLQNPYMARLAQKYRNNPKVACISVSFDAKAEDWDKYLSEEKPQWPHYRTSDGGALISEHYGFKEIPHYVIVDGAGNIVSSDAPRPSDIDKVSAIIDDLLR